MVPPRRRWSALALLVLAAVVIATANLALRRDTTDARAAEAGLRSELGAVEDHLVELAAQRSRLEVEQAVADRRLRAATERLEAAQQAEAEELDRLGARAQEREATEEELRVLQASVVAAAEQTEENQAAIEALDRCLDGATRAANALAVGDVGRAFADLGAVRDPCEQVDVVVG